MLDRQRLIHQYEEMTGATLVVFIDQIFEASLTYLEELIGRSAKGRRLHMLLASPGGDGETAIRILHSIDWRFDGLTVIVPDMAKSAATLVCLGADELILGPAADLGPVDPQFQVRDGLVSAKEIIAAVDEAEERVARNSASVPLFTSLLDVNMLMLQQARNSLKRSEMLVREALRCVQGRTDEQVEQLTDRLRGPLIEQPASHSSTIYAKSAIDLGLPARRADIESDEWQLIRALWTRYFTLGCFPNPKNVALYESAYASIVTSPEV